MLNDFKAFILRGNLVELAVAVIIGTAFGAVITSLVEDVFTPLLAFAGETDFKDLKWKVGGGEVLYGEFINAVIAFLTVAAVVFFFVIKPVNALMSRRKTEPDVESITKECDYCLSSVPARAIVCAFCTREIDRPGSGGPSPAAI